jgi:predicted transcriptional regulator
MKQQKRHKLQLFYDILSAIEQDMYQNEGTSLAKPTRVQQYSRLSYDKMTDLFGDLKNKHMILRYKSNVLLMITSKGRTFLKQYRELIDLIEDLGVKK